MLLPVDLLAAYQVVDSTLVLQHGAPCWVAVTRRSAVLLLQLALMQSACRLQAARASTYNNPPSWQQAAAKATSVNSGGGAYSDTLVTGGEPAPSSLSCASSC